jgi:UDP-GlcNAc:undecaprenyl-phosphate/decaprenyl-phosphate GlcNAc-1-phosphate transferase
VLLLGVPIFDTTLVSISRARRGLLPFTSPGKDHTSHRLAGLGLGHRRAVLVVYLAGALCGLGALAFVHLPAVAATSVVAAVVVGAGAAIAALERCSFERQEHGVAAMRSAG